MGQESFLGPNGNVFTQNSLEVYRVFKGEAELTQSVVTEGGVFGDVMQLVTPSIQLQIGDYGVLVLEADEQRNSLLMASNFISINEANNAVSGSKNFSEREQLYKAIGRTTGSSQMQLLRSPAVQAASSKNAVEIGSVYPLEVTAGTKTLITISGQGFGQEQDGSCVAFHNADDGGQSFVGLNSGPHYVNWSDTEIQIYVPSATLYNSTVAGTGSIQVIKANGAIAESQEYLTVNYAKSEVIYAENLNETMLVAKQYGGYEFTVNQNLLAFLGNSELAAKCIEKWACNTGANLRLGNAVTSVTEFGHDQINVLGLSNPGQLPTYLLGRTITTFSSCGTTNGLQWNLAEVDILLNADIDWWISESQPEGNTFDIETALLHELGHAHLLQHNNDPNSPMYFELTTGTARRDLHLQADIEGGQFVATSSANADHTCSDEYHQPYDNSNCNLSVINGVGDEAIKTFSVYPNPFSDEILVSAEWLNEAEYSIFDATGRTVQSGSFGSSAIPTTKLSKGIYLLEVNTATEKFAQRIVKN